MRREGGEGSGWRKEAEESGEKGEGGRGGRRRVRRGRREEEGGEEGRRREEKGQDGERQQRRVERKGKRRWRGMETVTVTDNAKQSDKGYMQNEQNSDSHKW